MYIENVKFLNIFTNSIYSLNLLWLIFILLFESESDPLFTYWHELKTPNEFLRLYSRKEKKEVRCIIKFEYFVYKILVFAILFFFLSSSKFKILKQINIIQSYLTVFPLFFFSSLPSYGTHLNANDVLQKEVREEKRRERI